MDDRPFNPQPIMENPAQFDLNDAIGRWRMNLQGSSALLPQDVDELESHVRDSVEALQAAGLSPEEAFMIAVQRAGSNGQLEREFAKVNPHRVWIDRSLWMVAGILLIGVVVQIARVLTTYAVNLSLARGANAHLTGLLEFLTQFAAIGGGSAVCWWLISRRSRWISRLAEMCLQRPLIAGVALVTLLYNLYPLALRLLPAHSPIPFPFDEGEIAILTAWSRASTFAEMGLWVVGLPFLARYAWRTGQTRSPSSRRSGVERPEPHEHEATRGLQSKGLSGEEVCSIMANRKARGQGLPFERKESVGRQVWIERCMWMVAGNVLHRFIQSNVLEPAWVVEILMRTVAWQAPIYAHLAGFLSVATGWILVVALVAALGALVTRFQNLSYRIGRFCCQRPLWTALALLLSFAVPTGILWWAMTTLLTPSSLSMNPVVHPWQWYGLFRSPTVVLVALLLALARRRVKLHCVAEAAG